MKTQYPTHSALTRLMLQLLAGQWLRRRIGGGKFCRLAPLLLLALIILGACTTDPTYPDTYDTRSVADSTAGDGITIVVDTVWDGERHYTFDNNDSVHLVIPDSVPTGDAGNAA